MLFKQLTAAAGIGSTALIAASCTTAELPEPPSAAQQCETPRPQVCTMIYAPVCATHSDGHQETHASGCNACADDTVVSHVDGPCEETLTP